MTSKTIDYLDEDPIIHGQEWICVSFLSPEGVKNCKLRGFKFRGAFPTRQEAEAHAKEIQSKLDPNFHVYVGEGFKWLPWDQDPETVENQEYHEKELNELMKATKENLLLKKQHEQERKNQQIKEAMEKNDAVMRTNKERARLQRKLMKKQQEKTEQTNNEKAEPPEIKCETEKLNTEETKVSEEKKKLNELNSCLSKLQATYDKLIDDTKQNKK